jgi:hypothetical protein
MEINNAKQVAVGTAPPTDTPNWTDTNDLSCRARWLYDDTYIYLYAEVTDDARVNIQVDQQDATNWGNSWQGDGFETYLQLDPYDSSRNDYATDRNYQWTMGVNENNDVSWKIFRDAVGDVTPFSATNPIPMPGDNVKVVSTTSPKGYILEARFKWTDFPDVNTSLIPPKPGTGAAIGMAVNDTDTDGAQRESQLSWNTYADLWTQPNHFTRAVWAGTDPINLTFPTAPTNLTATSTGPSVVLTWDAVPGATGYKVRRSLGATSTPKNFVLNTGTTPVTATTIEDKPLKVGSVYKYAVVATNLAGDSLNSNVVTVTVGSGSGGSCTLGDVTGDVAGEVDVTDAVALLQHIVGIALITDPNRLKAADADKSGSVDVGDAVRVLQIVVGIQAKESCP